MTTRNFVDLDAQINNERFNFGSKGTIRDQNGFTKDSIFFNPNDVTSHFVEDNSYMKKNQKVNKNSSIFFNNSDNNNIPSSIDTNDNNFNYNLNKAPTISKNSIFGFSSPILKPACKMTKEEIQEQLLSPFKPADLAISEKSNTTNLNVKIESAKLLNDDVISVPINTNRYATSTPLYTTPNSERRVWVDLDEEDVSAVVNYRSRNSSFIKPNPDIIDSAFNNQNHNFAEKKIPDINLQNKLKIEVNIDKNLIQHTPKSEHNKKNLVSHPAVFDNINLSFLPTANNFLGEGRFCKVYRANYTLIDQSEIQTCAVKRIHPDQEAQTMGLAELCIFRKIGNKHSNIIKFIGAKDESDIDSWNIKKNLQTPTTPAIPPTPLSHLSPTSAKNFIFESFTMDASPRLLLLLEYAPRGNLWDYMISNGPTLGKQLWTKWAYQIAGALSCIHSCGIVHHDIKPHNTLLSENLDVKIADFGNACFSSPQEPIASTVTLEGSQSFPPLDDGLGRGTQAYSAPEMLSPPTIYSFPVDVYSVGVTLITLTTGVEPFSLARNSVHMIMGIKKGFFESGLQAERQEQWKFLNKQLIGNNLKKSLIDMVSLNPLNRPKANEISGIIEVSLEKDLLEENLNKTQTA